MSIPGLNSGNILILHKAVFMRILRESSCDSAVVQELSLQEDLYTATVNIMLAHSVSCHLTES